MCEGPDSVCLHGNSLSNVRFVYVLVDMRCMSERESDKKSYADIHFGNTWVL